MTAVECQHKDKPQVLTPTKVVPGDGDFEVSELPRVQWTVPKGVFIQLLHLMAKYRLTG